MTGGLPLTVVIAARNEATQIGACITSASFASEILVVENDSTDDTVDRARSAGATVFSHPFVTIGQQRNAAMARAANDWVLVLDADERATPELAVELAANLATLERDAYRIGRRNLFLGREIRHGGWGGGRDRPVRLVRRDLRYDDRPVHEHIMTADRPVGELRAQITHEPYNGLDEYFDKLVRYSRDWAAQHFARGRRVSLWSVVVKPPARFVSMLVLRGGWRDGAPGVLLAVLASISVAAKYAFLWELGRRRARSG